MLCISSSFFLQEYSSSCEKQNKKSINIQIDSDDNNSNNDDDDYYDQCYYRNDDNCFPSVLMMIVLENL